MKIILFIVSFTLLSLNAGCIVRYVINNTTTCTTYIRGQPALPKGNRSDPAQRTLFNETVGEYLIFMVREQLDSGQICKQYQIKVDEYAKDMGNIRLIRSGSCSEDANFDIFVEEFHNIPIKRCIINVYVYDSNRVTLQILDESAKAEKPLITEISQKVSVN